jgi:hypothetical protein
VSRWRCCPATIGRVPLLEAAGRAADGWLTGKRDLAAAIGRVNTYVFGLTTLTCEALASGALAFGIVNGHANLRMLVGTFTPPALARSAQTNTTERATETPKSFDALDFSLPCRNIPMVECSQYYAV